MGICTASSNERRQDMPADDIIAEPIAVWMHGITIDAPPERVWPWLAESFYLNRRAINTPDF